MKKGMRASLAVIAEYLRSRRRGGLVPLASSCLLPLISCLFLGCERSEKIELRCGPHGVAGALRADVARLTVGGYDRVLPLQGIFTDEPAAKYAPRYLSRPEFAMTIKNYVGLDASDKKIDFAVFSRKDKIEYYELEIENEGKWQCGNGL